MGRTAKSFIDKKNATVYRLVHPTDEDGNTIAQGGGVRGQLAMVAGNVSYFSEDDEEEYPYREDSSGDEADEEEAMARREKKGEEIEVEEEWEEEEDVLAGEMLDDFAEEGLPQPRNWRRTEEDTQSEYSSWSQRTASSYLPPERRKQLWCDIEEFGLADDGYDYTQHLRNPGSGVRLAAHMPAELEQQLVKKAARTLAKAPRAAREVISLLEDSDDEAAPPLEEEAGESEEKPEWVQEGERLIDEGVVVEEGDELPDDFAMQLNADREDDFDAVEEASGPPREMRLLDEQFDYFLKQYEDDQIGELDDDVGYLPQNGEEKDEAYYYALLRSYVNGTAMPGGDQVEDDGEIILERPPAWVDLEEEVDEGVVQKTKALALKDESSEEELEEVEVEEKEEWDCESILSTYSNIYNHPKTIADSRAALRIAIDPRTGVPAVSKADAQAPAQPRAEPLAEGDEEGEEGEEEGGEEGSEGAGRPGVGIVARERGESAEDKKARKEAAKAQKAQARQKKKDKQAALASQARRGAPPPGPGNAADPRTRPGLSVTRF